MLEYYFLWAVILYILISFCIENKTLFNALCLILGIIWTKGDTPLYHYHKYKWKQSLKISQMPSQHFTNKL